MNKKILWVDDEIHFFRPHIEFLKNKGYIITGVTNGDDAVELFKKEHFDLVLLDEMMIGMDGLETLSQIRAVDFNVPVVMITKNEDEALMQSAIAQQITDFLTKPVNPSQILSVFIKLFNSKEIKQNRAIANLTQDFARIRNQTGLITKASEWIDLYTDIMRIELLNENIKDEELKSVLKLLKEEVNTQFAHYIKDNYVDLILGSDDVFFSHQFMPRIVVPQLKSGKKVYLFLLDCMRADQWQSMASVISDHFNVDTKYYLSILPTATPFSRNAIFSGKLPLTLHQKFPGLIPWFQETESGKNDNEYDLLLNLLEEYNVNFRSRPYFTKILDVNWAEEVYKKLNSLKKIPFVSFVFNFLDIIIHHRANSKLLQEIVFDELTFRTVAKNWFENSWIYRMLLHIAKKEPDALIILTTDHGSILCNKPLVIKGDNRISYSLRFKQGNYLKLDTRHGWLIKNPERIFLPKNSVLSNYAFAYNNYYFAFTGNVGQFSQKYNNNFFHGGVSLEEMVLPYAYLTVKK